MTLAGLGVASAFAPPAALVSNVAKPATALNVFSEATNEFEETYFPFAKYGWGPSVQAEVWNGRHAMFGWVFMCATAYAKGHGLIPDAETTLNLKEWGTLATISGKETISNERAIILIANVHCFFVGLMATICPNPYSDPLLADPNHPRYEAIVERNSKPYGIIPEFKFGITEEAEMMNGRLAMMGIITVVCYSFITGMPVLDVINQWVGGAYY